MNSDLGYDPTNTMSLPIPVHDGTYQTWKARSEYFERLRAVIGAMSQVEAAGISTIEILGKSSAGEKPVARNNSVSAEYFSLLRIKVAQGRLWTPDETARGAALAVINQTMARQYWPNSDPIGQQFRIPGLRAEPPYTLLLLTVAVIACLSPARRAASIDPMRALRTD